MSERITTGRLHRELCTSLLDQGTRCDCDGPTVLADLRERLAAAIERNCLSDAFLDPDDPDNAYKVCRYCFAAARIVRSRP